MMCVSVANCEHSHSKLKSVETYLRSQTSDAPLSSLERELAEQLNCRQITKDSSARKAMKEPAHLCDIWSPRLATSLYTFLYEQKCYLNASLVIGL